MPSFLCMRGGYLRKCTPLPLFRRPGPLIRPCPNRRPPPEPGNNVPNKSHRPNIFSTKTSQGQVPESKATPNGSKKSVPGWLSKWEGFHSSYPFRVPNPPPISDPEEIRHHPDRSLPIPRPPGAVLPPPMYHPAYPAVPWVDSQGFGNGG